MTGPRGDVSALEIPSIAAEMFPISPADTDRGRMLDAEYKVGFAA